MRFNTPARLSNIQPGLVKPANFPAKCVAGDHGEIDRFLETGDLLPGQDQKIAHCPSDDLDQMKKKADRVRSDMQPGPAARPAAGVETPFGV
jgi:hypothetical protein